MRPKFILLFGMLAVCLLSTHAQTVNEAESRLVLQINTAGVSLAVENSGRNFDADARLELLDIEGNVRAKTSTPLRIKPGKENYQISLPLGNLLKDVENDIIWYRLRYRVGAAEGIVSLSQLVTDNFELRVIASGNVFAGMNYRTRVLATHPFTGLPIEGVELEMELDLDLKGEGDPSLKLTSSGRTDAEGFAVLDFQVPLETELAGDGDINVVGRKNGLESSAKEDLDSAGNDSSFLVLTDKPIYQPGQDVRIRGILLKGAETRTAVAGGELVFSVEDEDNTLLYRETVRTSEFGIASISWKIPENAKLGTYDIRIKSPGDDDLAVQKVKVSRYDLPNFTVTAKPDKSYYLPGEKTARVDVTADYLFGKPVTKGKVRIVRENEREWNWKEQKYDIDEGESHSGETDQAGKFTAAFDLSEELDDLDDDDWRKFKDVHFAAYFTDATTNRTEQRRFDIRVTREPIHVYFIGEMYNNNPNVPISAYVSTFYADGTPAVCNVEVKGSEDDEDKFKKLQHLKTNSFGIGKLNFRRPAFEDEDSDMDLRIIATDANGNKGTSSEDINFDDDDVLQIRTERTIYKPGESINVTIDSTQKTGKVYLDIVQGWSVIDSYFTSLADGKARFKVPYQPGFKGELKIAAYLEAEEDDDELIHAARGILYPSPQNLKLDVSSLKTVYKPSEDAAINFDIWEPDGKPVESALGIVIVDKAVEDRARSDGEFNGAFSGFRGWIGYGSSFGAVNIKDLNELDLSKPVSDDLQLVGEALLHNSYYYPNIFYSAKQRTHAVSVYAKYFQAQFAPVENALRSYYIRHDQAHPTDEQSLKKILAENSIDLGAFRDPWGQNYRAEFTVEKISDVTRFISAGADKRFGTNDDFAASSSGFLYFTADGKKIDQVLQNFHTRTGSYIFNEKDFYRELGVSDIKDRFGRPYQIIFAVSNRNYYIRVHSLGPADASPWDRGFDVWTSKIDYFSDTELKVRNSLQAAASFPKNVEELRSFLKASGIDLKNIRDGYGAPIYITQLQTSRYVDKVTIENISKYGDETPATRTIITPVTQQIRQFTLRSKGADGKENTYDDFTLAQFQHVLSEQAKDAPKPQTPMQPVVFRSGAGALAGVVTDSNGAVVPGATVSATNEVSNQLRTTTSDTNGRFLIANLTAGSYSLRVTLQGFMNYVMTNIAVKANSTASVNVTLSAGNVSAVVDVSGGDSEVMTTSNTTGTTITGSRTLVAVLNKKVKDDEKAGPESEMAELRSTPKLREYFPETLVWSPEIITDKNGKAELKFKFADNITTWKVYTIASTKQGKLGVAEKELQAFQPFFVDLEPPKFLTEGDEIHLPVTIRNYTPQKQRVSVAMAKADWFSFLAQPEQQIDVSSGSAKNAVFGFRAASVVKDGKQRVTAVAQTDSDAIEKPVTVKPNGQEIVKTSSQFFSEKAVFNLEFPANALPQTQKAELKIYPNLMAHVSESVEGLLKRPYGCGEQTISSTYPNLMLLKFLKDEGKLRQTAQKYLRQGYERLLGYQVAGGGFSYWGGKDFPDIALTAYAIRFLTDARDHISVDKDVIQKAQNWLIAQQRADGSWTKKYSYETTEDLKRTKLLTAYVARVLAIAKEKNEPPLQKALSYLKTRATLAGEIDEPYSMALLGLSSFDAGDRETAAVMAAKLSQMAIAEGDSAYWNLESNTPFYGWGTAGRLETTALVLQLFAKLRSEDHRYNELISRGMIFMLKNKDRYGVWYSTQTTINVLDAFLALLRSEAPNPAQPETLSVLLNGNEIQNISIASDKLDPIVIDVSDKLTPAENRFELKTSSSSPLMSQLVSTHYIDWKNSEVSSATVNQSRALRLAYTCDKQTAAIMQEINCGAEMERVGFKGYGMLLAEIGIPPGAEVSRESLEKAMEADQSLSRYDILPDRIVVYMWAKAGGTKLNFSFRPRYGINAQTPASIVYDYYNPEAQAIIAPLKFSVK